MTDPQQPPEDLEFTTKIPASLDGYRSAIDVGMYYLALDADTALEIPAGESKSARIRISGPARCYFDRLKRRFGSDRQVVINALAWVATQEPARRALLLHTTI